MLSIVAAPAVDGSSAAPSRARGARAAATRMASTAAQMQQRPSYGARVEVVRIHAAVLDGDGHPVTDLGADDFVVMDNGVEYPVALALTPAEAPIDVALVFDQSDSIRLGAPTVKRDARAFLDALDAEDCAFVLPFQHRIGPGVWGPSVDPSLLQTVDLTPLEGGTSFNDALMVGLAEVQRWNVPDILPGRIVTEYQQPTIVGGVGIDFGAPEVSNTAPAPEAPGFSRGDLPFRVFERRLGCGSPASTVDPERRKAMVVLSDGIDTTSAHTFGELVGFVHQGDVPVFTVAIGHPGAAGPSRRRDAQRAARIAESRLRTLAEITGGRFVVGSGSESRLREAYDEIITILRGSYLLGYYPRPGNGPAASADVVLEHDIEVKVRRSGLDVFARSEYTRGSSDVDTARKMLRRGARLALDGELDSALAAATQAIAADGGLWDAHFLDAAVRWMAHDPGAALPALQRALWLEPGVAAAHQLASQVYYELGDDASAWREAIRAQLAGADMEQEIRMLAARSASPEALEARLNVPRVFVEGDRRDDPEAGARSVDLRRALARAVSESPVLGLVRDPLAADYFLYVNASDVDSRRPRRFESRLELYDYVDQRLWRGDMDVADIEDPKLMQAAVKAAVARLETWLREDR